MSPNFVFVVDTVTVNTPVGGCPQSTSDNIFSCFTIHPAEIQVQIWKNHLAKTYFHK